MLNTALSVIQVFLAAGVIFLVLLHSGKDAGMSGAFGVGVAGGTSGGSLMEKNLDRWTILFAVLFAVNTVAILKTLSRGSRSDRRGMRSCLRLWLSWPAAGRPTVTVEDRGQPRRSRSVIVLRGVAAACSGVWRNPVQLE